MKINTTASFDLGINYVGTINGPASITRLGVLKM